MFSYESDSFMVSVRPVRRRGAVFDECNVVIEHEADREGVEDAHTGADTGDKQTFDAARAEQHVEISADKGAVAVFSDDHFIRLWFQAGMELGAP